MDEVTSHTVEASSGARLAVSPSEAARLAGVGRTTLYQALGSGALRSLRIGRRRLITIEALRDWLAAAEREASNAR